jgi:ATP-dependent RNA circularization protein (DNA/RNA ligase family)
MGMIPSYPDIHALGSPATKDLFTGLVLVEEKVDGSNMSMARLNGAFVARSRGKELIDGAVEKIFSLAYEYGKALPLRDGWIYRGECISKPRHNALTYGRTPKGCFVIFDITEVNGEWLTTGQKKQEADRLGLEVVPCFYEGSITPEAIKGFIGRESFLGLAPIEGVVVKPLNYDLYGRDKKVVMGKRWRGSHG